MDRVPRRLKIFPLGAVVLFPGVSAPLHIFEPRYRTMLSDALAGDRVIGMVLVRTSAGREPVPVHAIGCAGRIVAHEPLEALDRQSLLEAVGAEQRCRRLIELLDFRMASERLGLDPDRGSNA